MEKKNPCSGGGGVREGDHNYTEWPLSHILNSLQIQEAAKTHNSMEACLQVACGAAISELLCDVQPSRIRRLCMALCGSKGTMEALHGFTGTLKTYHWLSRP